MKRTTKKGFTLIELLAVIVILAIIALIAVPVILNIIDKANIVAFKDTAYSIISAGELYFAREQLDLEGMKEEKTFSLPDTTNTLEIKGDVPEGYITITRDGDIELKVKNDRYCVTKGLKEDDITITDDPENCVIPIKIIDMELNETLITLTEGKSATIGLAITPSSATNKTLNYVSSNETVAVVDNTGLVTAVSEGSCVITITTTDGSNISGTIEIVVKGPIMTSTNSCINSGNICSSDEIKLGVKVNVAVNDSQNYDFYVIKDDGEQVTLIMSENLGDNVAWNTDESNISNSIGPTTAVSELKSRTNNWINIPEKTYIYSDDGGGNKYTSFPETMRARMIKYIEARELGCITGVTNPPSWFNQNLYTTGSNEDSVGNIKLGYWTSAANSSVSTRAHVIDATGLGVSSTSGRASQFDPYSSRYGLRPVIELSK